MRRGEPLVQPNAATVAIVEDEVGERAPNVEPDAPAVLAALPIAAIEETSPAKMPGLTPTCRDERFSALSSRQRAEFRAGKRAKR